MREILFRGKAKKTNYRYKEGEWIYGNLAKMLGTDCEDKLCIQPWERDVEGVNSVITEVVPETVGQYTGLTDKNGTKIFEGDILESRASENKEDWKRWQVIFYDGSYCFERDNPHKRKHKHEQNLLSEDEIELYGLVVVGNIHDNPELLDKI